MNLPDPPAKRRKTGFGLQKKLQLRIDMTPMVDLGFLLISFFVITTSLADPKTMYLNMPSSGPRMPIKYSTALTFLPAANNSLYYYFGDSKDAIPRNQVFETSYLTKDIGKIVAERKIYLIQHRIKPSELFIMIKPGRKARYKDVVNLLDEMFIHKVERYSIIEQEKLEADFIQGK